MRGEGRSASVLAPTLMQSNDRAALLSLDNCVGVDADIEQPSPLAVALLILNNHSWPLVVLSSATTDVVRHHLLERYNYLFAICFRIFVSKTNDIRVNGPRCFTFITIGMPM